MSPSSLDDGRTDGNISGSVGLDMLLTDDINKIASDSECVGAQTYTIDGNFLFFIMFIYVFMLTYSPLRYAVNHIIC